LKNVRLTMNTFPVKISIHVVKSLKWTLSLFAITLLEVIIPGV
jgi:hypothetical protein